METKGVVRMVAVQCEAVAGRLVEAVDHIEILPPAACQHIETCLRCQAELAQLRKMKRVLGSLQDRVLVPDPELLDQVLESIRPPATVHKIHRRSRKAVYVRGIAAGAAAWALVWVARAGRERIAS